MDRRQFLAASAACVAGASYAAEAGQRKRVAVIGHTGRGNYGHGLDTMWLHVPQVELVAVADANATGLAAAKKKLRVAAGYADYHRMLVETKPDIVAVCPRHADQHRDMVLAAVEAGARGVYVEKPFGRTPAEADEMVAACERRGARLAVAHRNRYHPVVAVVAKMVADGAIGRLLEIRGRGKEDARGGAVDLWVLGCHVLNLAVAFSGPAVACSAVLAQAGRPVSHGDVREGEEGLGPVAGDEVHARFETERGVPLFFDSVKGAGSGAAGFGLQLVGADGVIDFRVDTDPLAHLVAGSPFAPPREPRRWVPISTAGPGKPEPLTGLAAQVAGHLLSADDLLAAMRDKRPPLCGAIDGRLTVEMITAVFESHRLGGRRVTLPLATRQNPLASL